MLKIKKLLFEKKVAFIWVLILPLVAVIMIVYSFQLSRLNAQSNVVQKTDPVAESGCPVSMDQIREKHSPFVRPLLLADVISQDQSMSTLKSQLENYIREKVNSGVFQIASVYIRKLDDGSYITINENELFNPASLMKMAYLISYLKEEELKPGLLQKKVFFAKHFVEGNAQNIVSFALKENNQYSLMELLQAMIIYSDNDATALLMQNLNMAIFNSLFSDLKLPAPPIAGEYFIGTTDYAKFFRVLYNSTYLKESSSEFAIQLLLKSTFKEGICSGIDPGVPVAHKFGERVLNNISQLHEFGIVYLNNAPYLIGIMTKGGNLAPLKQSVGEMSGIVFRYMQNPS